MNQANNISGTARGSCEGGLPGGVLGQRARRHLHQQEDVPDQEERQNTTDRRNYQDKVQRPGEQNGGLCSGYDEENIEY